MREARYITPGQSKTVSQLAQAIRAQVDEMLTKDYLSAKERKLAKQATPQAFEQTAKDFFGLNEALLHGRTVFAECEKEPRNLDAGSHYYSIYYNNAKGESILFWPGEFLYWYAGQERQDRDHSMRRYIFKSGAIGMSRLFDATDGLFVRLKTLTGTYAQIS